MEVRNKRLSDEEFFKERKEVLAEWPTGQECDLDGAIAYQKSMPPSRNHILKLAEGRRTGKILLSINSGRSTVESHIELLQCVQDAGASLLTTWIDAMTRNHRYEAAEKAVEEAERTGKQVLNGLPIVHYGVPGTRKITESVDNPITVLANGPDMRLIIEIALAGGFTGSTMGGAICCFQSYTRDLPLDVIIRNYQYRYRLIGIYEERGIPLQTNAPGLAGGFLVPPSMGCAETILEALFAAEQGVRHMSIASGGASGNLAQDFGVYSCMRELAAEYLNRFGYKEVAENELIRRVGGSSPYGKWSTDQAQGFARLAHRAYNAWLCGARQLAVTSLDEGSAIPIKENSAASLRCVRMVLDLLKDQKPPFDVFKTKAVKEEEEMVEREVRAILDRVIELGDGDVVVGTIRGFEAGVLDNPWATNKNIAGRAIGVRDAQGALRWFDHGNLPFSQDIIDFHKEKISGRAEALGREVSYDALVADIAALGNGTLLSESGEEEEIGVTV